MNIVLVEPLGVDRKLIEGFSDKLSKAGHSLTVYDTCPADQEELAGRVRNADAVVMANYPFRREAILKAERLKYIDIAFTGVDHVDLDTCRERGIGVSNASGYSDIAVAELAFALMLSLSRNVLPCDTAARRKGTKEGLVGTELYGKTLGVVGAGRIGSAVMKIGLAFGCRVLSYSRTPKPELEAMGIAFVSLEKLMAQSDIVTLHVPVDGSTRGMINAEMISRMKQNAILINTARGPVVDSEALADALNHDRIAGAGIDVFEMEPPIPENHPLVTAKHTLLTPHVAFATKEALERRAGIVFDNMFAWLDHTIKNRIC